MLIAMLSNHIPIMKRCGAGFNAKNAKGAKNAKIFYTSCSLCSRKGSVKRRVVGVGRLGLLSLLGVWETGREGDFIWVAA